MVVLVFMHSTCAWLFPRGMSPDYLWWSVEYQRIRVMLFLVVGVCCSRRTHHSGQVTDASVGGAKVRARSARTFRFCVSVCSVSFDVGLIHLMRVCERHRESERERDQESSPSLFFFLSSTHSEKKCVYVPPKPLSLFFMHA